MSRKLAAVAVAGVAGALTLAGCSAFEIHGTVTSKQYIPGYYTFYQQPTYRQSCHEVEEEEPVGSKGQEEPEEESVCTSVRSGYRTVSQWHSDCWQLSVAGKQGGDECVSESTYDNTKIGDTV